MFFIKWFTVISLTTLWSAINLLSVSQAGPLQTTSQSIISNVSSNINTTMAENDEVLIEEIQKKEGLLDVEKELLIQEPQVVKNKTIVKRHHCKRCYGGGYEGGYGRGPVVVPVYVPVPISGGGGGCSGGCGGGGGGGGGGGYAYASASATAYSSGR